MQPTALPALVTPFDPDGRLDLDLQRSNIDAVSRHPSMSGALVAGSTGQGQLLEPGERRSLIEAARRAVSDIYLLVGIMAESTSAAIDLVQESADAGADEVLVLPPVTLARSDVAAQQRFLTSIADTSPVPVLLYSVPKNTGYHVDADLIVTMSAHPNVVGLKDSGGDIERIGRLVEATPDSFRIYNGASRTALAALRAGCAGLITASGNYAPDLIGRVLAGEDAAQEELTRLSGIVESFGIGGVTTAGRMAGFVDGGVPRAPLGAVDAAELGDVAGSLV